MGAKLDGVGTGHLEIQGVPALAGATHQVIADRIEAGTLIAAGAITAGDVTVTDVAPEHLAAVLAKLDECGVDVAVGPAWGRVGGPRRPRAAALTPAPVPRFPPETPGPTSAPLGLAHRQ